MDKYIQQIYNRSQGFICSLWGLLQHVLVQRDRLQVIRTSKITKNMYWGMGGVNVNVNEA